MLVNNISVEPFRLVAPTFPSDTREEAPSTAWRLASNGEADLAVISVAKLGDVQAVMEPIGDFGVACTGAVGSVLLFGRSPLADLVNQRRPIHMTTDSETSRRLLRLLCRREFGIDPVVTTNLVEAHGRLCIGDEALRLRCDPRSWPVVSDLCEWWTRQTGLPFVFARRMVRRSVTPRLKREAEDWLVRCVAAAGETSHRKAMARRALQNNLFDSLPAAEHYFTTLRNRLTQADVAGQELFLREVELPQRLP